VATDTPSRTIRVTLSSDPKCFSRDSENVERREVRRLAARFHIELRAPAPNDFCLAAFSGKHALKKSKLPVSTAST
jgi:hypothetical protein